MKLAVPSIQQIFGIWVTHRAHNEMYGINAC